MAFSGGFSGASGGTTSGIAVVSSPTTNAIPRLTAAGQLDNSTVTLDSSGNIILPSGSQVDGYDVSALAEHLATLPSTAISQVMVGGVPYSLGTLNITGTTGISATVTSSIAQNVFTLTLESGAPDKWVIHSDHFDNTVIATKWPGAGSGGTSATAGYVTTLQDPAHPGVVQLGTSTASNGFYTLTSTGGWMLSASRGDEYKFDGAVSIPILSTPTERFEFSIGLTGQPTTAGTGANEFAFYCSDYINSGNWMFISAITGVYATVTSSVAPSTTGFDRLQMSLSGSRGVVKINNTTIGEITGAFPVANMSRCFKINKQIGVTQRTVLVDYYFAQKRVT